MRITMVRAVLASGMFFACSANAWPTQIQGNSHDKPSSVTIACRVATYNMEGEIDNWRCQACFGNGMCSPTWLSDVNQTGSYD